ncbi:MMS19 nucleotide excision repair protein-like protein [Colletotrichum shisoi]|uniref:MMS19 nucleotide excision repair protein n=1 Tax=Colletotrichum shisoi TaxID=2078593 RepID=A0A5Q4BZ04_9PEZI|nr:MMS19 nucleotide excision repair protein-like protein [Colletotrichum shisoi]
MADFRKLAFEFVLSDDTERQTAITQEAASAIQSAPRPSNPVARWVESIKPWMPSANDGHMDDGEDGEADGDVIARSKALSFLAGTLEHLDPEFLKTDQVNLLVSFFGSMFKVDHKAGILPAAKALQRTASMKNFQPQRGNDIVQSVCSLHDDFTAQVAETRAAVYELLDHLIANPDVANDLQYQHGTTSGFITDLLQLCRNERDPRCLMTWFKVLRVFLSEFSPASEVVSEIFSIFSAYFPISLRTSQHPSGITAEDLKLALRSCFSAHHRVAEKGIPYLLGRLDQPDSVTVNVKVDILKTLTACLSNYEHVQQGAAPFSDKIWSSLKYEVRNGEIEDTINATLEVIRTIAKRLTGDELRDFALAVQRDCLEDLSNPIYTAASGKLIISVHSAKPAAFALMIAPSVTHVKDNLRHTKSPDHTKNLLILLNSLLELRQALIGGGVQLSVEDAEAFKVTEPMLAPLQSQTYLPLFQKALEDTAQKEDIAIGQQAVKGLGLMVCQRAAQTGESSQPMLPASTLSDICNNLASVIFTTPEQSTMADALSELENDAVLALQKALTTYPPARAKVIEDCLKLCRSYLHSTDAVSLQTTAPILEEKVKRLAYICCCELSCQGDLLSGYISYLHAIIGILHAMIDAKAHPRIWSILASGIHLAMRLCQRAVENLRPRSKTNNFDDKRYSLTWFNYVANRYPDLPRFDDNILTNDSDDAMDIDEQARSAGNDGDELHGEFILVSLFVVRQLYRRATQIISYNDDTELSLALSADFTSKELDDRMVEDDYLHALSNMAIFVIQQMTELEQTRLLLNEEVVTLFRGDDAYNHPDPDIGHPWQNSELRDAMLRTWAPQASYSMTSPPKFPISGFSMGRTVILSLGIIQPFHPTTIQRLVERGTAHQILIAGLLARDHSASPRCRHVVSAILTIISNKYPVEKLNEIVTMLQLQMNFIANEKNQPDEVEQVTGNLEHEANLIPGGNPGEVRAEFARPVYAILAGILRRYSGSSLKQLLATVEQGPSNMTIGHILGRNLETIFGDVKVLTKECYGQARPLWVQKAYFVIIKPMLTKAWPAGSNSKDDKLVAANYSIAVLAAVKHIRYPVYEVDTEDLIRLILCVIRYLPVTKDVAAALDVLQRIIENSPKRTQPFLQSVIRACMSIFNKIGIPVDEGITWMPAGYIPFDHSERWRLQCRCQAIRIIGLLPIQFEHRHLLDSASQVQRLLVQASGDKVRRVREAALTARAKWDEVN